ncbi:MAG: hypothetical protein ACR2NE_03875 [Pirellulales bacterium]
MFVYAQFDPLFAAGFDWLEAVLPLLFVFIWVISQVVAFFRRVGGRERAIIDNDEKETDPEMFLEERFGKRQCRACGASFVAPVLAIIDCPECGRLTPPEIDGNEIPEENEVVDPVEAEISAFLNRYIQTKQPSPVPAESIQEKTIALPISDEVGRSKQATSRTLVQQEEQTQSPPQEEGEISRHIHEVFDQGLNHLPDGVVESPWADLRDNTKRMVDTSGQEQKEEAPDFRLAAMLKDPATRKQLFILKEVLDRPKNLWE